MSHTYPTDDSDSVRSLADLYFYSLEDHILEVQVLEPRRNVHVPESLVQSLWKAQNFDKSDLRTAQGDPLEIVSPGRLNTDDGPDFLDARILINGVDWRGDVEIHTTSRAWNDHEHHRNPRYNATILHCTLFADPWTSRLSREDGSALPELVLHPHLKQSLRTLLRESSTLKTDDLPCRPLAHLTSTETKTSLLLNQAVLRLQEKKRRVEAAYLKMPDLEDVLHRLLFAGLGYARNTEAMLELARRIPLRLALSIDDGLDLEALHFGVAGLLPDGMAMLGLDRSTADFVVNLSNRFERLQTRLNIPVMPPCAWHFFRLRPANFPTLRIAQGVALLHSETFFRRGALGILENALAAQSPLQAMHTLISVGPSKFWADHFQFRNTTKPRDPRVGEDRFQRLLINAIVPVLLVHAEQSDRPFVEEYVVRLLKNMKAESDHVTASLQDAGFPISNAYISQGAHQLYRSYCSEKRCLDCSIGKTIIQQETSTRC